MAGASVHHGTGTSIVFGTNPYSGKLLSVEWSGISRPSLAVSHMSTTVATGATTNFGDALFIPGLFVDPGELALEFQFDPDQEFPNLHAVSSGTCTVTFPKVAGDSTAAKFTASDSFWTAIDISIPMEEVMTISITIKLSGVVAYGAAA